MKKILISGALSIIGLISVAQQDVQFTHYMYNTLAVNPGYAGSRGMLNITGLHRSQWVGIEGAPTTQTFFIHSPIGDEEKIGLGLSVINDKVGPISQTNFYGDFSYSITVNEAGHKLAFGAKAGLNMLQGNISQLSTTEAGDQSFANNIETTLSPNFGFGLYYHTEKWYVGASTPKLLESKIATVTSTDDAVQKRHYYIIGGLIIPINDNIKFKPTIMAKMTNAAPTSLDFTAQFLFNEKLWLGIMHRFQDSFGALLGYQFNPQLRAGYSYDYTISKLGNYNSGSHEIFLSYDFLFKKKKIVSPRYF